MVQVEANAAGDDTLVDDMLLFKVKENHKVNCWQVQGYLQVNLAGVLPRVILPHSGDTPAGEADVSADVGSDQQEASAAPRAASDDLGISHVPEYT